MENKLVYLLNGSNIVLLKSQKEESWSLIWRIKMNVSWCVEGQAILQRTLYHHRLWKSQKEAQDLMSDVTRQYFKQKMCVGRERIKDIALDGCIIDTKK